MKNLHLFIQIYGCGHGIYLLKNSFILFKLCLKNLQKKINYKFKNLQILKNALIHNSVKKNDNFQKYEFLGDRILSLCISEYLLQKYPQYSEGKISAMHSFYCSSHIIKIFCKKINLEKYCVYKSIGESKIVEDVCEALIASIYLDSKNIKEVKSIIYQNWPFNEKFTLHPKTLLQEYCQKKYNILPLYVCKNYKNGFTCNLNVLQYSVEDWAKCKKLAEKKAAIKMLNLWNGVTREL